MIVVNRDYLRGDGAPDALRLSQAIQAHMEELPRLERLRDYYDRKHDICKRVRKRGLPNNRIVCDYPRYIARMAAGYLAGKPVGYTADEEAEGGSVALASVLDAYDAMDAASIDAELAVDTAVYGRAVSVCYADARSAPCAAQLSPLRAFVCYDDTVEHLPAYGVHLRDRIGADGRPDGVIGEVYTAAVVQRWVGADALSMRLEGETPHFFGGVPLVEYWNNEDETGDFEGVIPLIDAYDVLQSDRVNDKGQFVDALLIFYGMQGGFAPPEDDTDPREAAQRIRDERMLALPSDARAEYLNKQLSEADVAVLARELRADIHKFAMVPDMSDEQFAGNVSGVAMRYKLYAFEQMTGVKERWFAEGLRARLRLVAHFLSVRGAAELDADRVMIAFSRNLPENLLEIAQATQALSGLVPDALLLSQIPFVTDVDAALAMLQEQKARAVAEAERAMAGDEGERPSSSGAE